MYRNPLADVAKANMNLAVRTGRRADSIVMSRPTLLELARGIGFELEPHEDAERFAGSVVVLDPRIPLHDFELRIDRAGLKLAVLDSEPVKTWLLATIRGTFTQETR